MTCATGTLTKIFMDSFQKAAGNTSAFERRIGVELKFPFVAADGTAASREGLAELWKYLEQVGWRAERDTLSGKVIGARTPGRRNDTVASCETGYCKLEFSLAHAGNLLELEHQIQDLLALLRDFSRKHEVHFLGYGIQPVTPPGKHLLIKKVRTSFWDKACPSNERIPKDKGDDVHLFTINAGSHVHVDCEIDEAIRAVNVLNGFAGAQIALTAHSNIWKGAIDPDYKCVNEKLWDWWRAAEGRSGIPEHPFDDIEDYVQTVASFRPIYAKRQGKPVILKRYDNFAEYFNSGDAVGCDLEGQPVALAPEPEDIDLHNSCYWFCARISRYYTVENRACDQQPPEDLLCIGALTLGLVTAADKAWEELRSLDWHALRRTREVACHYGMRGKVGSLELADLARRMLAIAESGLRQRGFGEERFLDQLKARADACTCPADETARLFQAGGMGALVNGRSL